MSPGDGERITAIKTLYLPLENEEVLVIFKERSTYMLTGNDADTFTLQKVSGEFGAVSHQSVVQAGSELLFLSREGITSLSTATVQGNLTTGFISDRIRPAIDGLNRQATRYNWALDTWTTQYDGRGGVVKQILVRESQQVRAGQPMLLFNDVEARANVDSILLHSSCF